MASIKGTRTEKNLLAAFAGESQARNRYTYFASAARKEGYEHIANLFIDALNSLGLNLLHVDPESTEYKGQYSGKALLGASLQAIQGLRKMYAPAK